jgi:hypothetical protein
MWRAETWPAMLMTTLSPAPDSDNSVTKMWRLSCHRRTTFALFGTLVHAVNTEHLRGHGVAQEVERVAFGLGYPEAAKQPETVESLVNSGAWGKQSKWGISAPCTPLKDH